MELLLSDERPKPEQFLARLQTESDEQPESDARGKLKIYFGFAAGVGKTYSMLEAARQAAIAGSDVVLGYIEPHGRPETESLLLGQELLRYQEVEYRNVTLKEFDLDAALKRKPEILLVDELAHTNAPGMRHQKRWQDVEEILDAGINVWTTLNVQHIESLNDVVAQITGITVRETLPDAVFDRAEEIELVDLPPDDLLERFRDGKVYVPEQAAQAVQRFFKKPNLIALREIAMRRVADRIGSDVQTARLGETRTRPWPTRERLLVCVSPSPTSAKVIRTAKRMASAMHAEWIAVHTEKPATQHMDARDRQRLAAHLRLVEQLGGETVTISGEDVAQAVIDYAQQRNVTKIVIGKTGRPRWYRFWRPTIVDRLIALSEDTDVYVIRGLEEKLPLPPQTGKAKLTWDLRGYLYAAGVLATTTGIAWGFYAAGLAEANLVMVYLLGVVFVASRFGRGPSIFASIASVLLFNFFFTHPFYTFAVRDTQYIFTFGVMLVIALIISTLTTRIRDQVHLARQRARRTEALYRISHRLAGTSGTLQIVMSAQQQLAELFDAEAALFLPDDDGHFGPAMAEAAPFANEQREIAVARWVLERRRTAGKGSDTLPDAGAMYLPLNGAQRTVGVLGIRTRDPLLLSDPEQRQMLDTAVSQIALAIERDQLAHEAQQILAQAEAEKLRSSLLSSVSHDLRTPLAAIAGASSSLLEPGKLSEATRRELLETVYEESDRLSRLVENLLHMTRIESKQMEVTKQWQPLEEVVGSALGRLKSQLADRKVNTDLPADLPLVPIDGLLIEQVLINLIDNAAKYSLSDTPIEIRAHADKHHVTVEVLDRGPGLPPGDTSRLFDKFQRGETLPAGTRGAGLGLAICRAIIQAHGGDIRAENRSNGGARFAFTIPIEGAPPKIDESIFVDEPEREQPTEHGRPAADSDHRG